MTYHHPSFYDIDQAVTLTYTDFGKSAIGCFVIFVWFVGLVTLDDMSSPAESETSSVRCFLDQVTDPFAKSLAVLFYRGLCLYCIAFLSYVSLVGLTVVNAALMFVFTSLAVALNLTWLHEQTTANTDLFLEFTEDGCFHKWKYYNYFCFLWTAATFLLTLVESKLGDYERKMGTYGNTDEHLPLRAVSYTSYVP